MTTSDYTTTTTDTDNIRVRRAEEGMNGSGGGGMGAVIGAAAVGFLAGMAANMGRKAAVEGLSAAQGDWFDTLRAEHRAVEKVFHAINQTRPGDTAKRTALLSKLVYALQKHAIEEENVIYPELRLHDDGSRARQLASDHADIKTFLHELQVLPKNSPDWTEKVRELQELVLQHVQEEEQDVYPHFRQRMSRQQNKKLTMLLHKEGLKLA